MEKTMDFNVFIEQDEDGVYVARVPEIEGCYTQGKTLEEAIERIKEAVEVCLEADKEEIKPINNITNNAIKTPLFIISKLIK